MVRRALLVALILGALSVWAGTEPAYYWLSIVAWLGVLLAACFIAVVLIVRNLFGGSTAAREAKERKRARTQG